MQCRLCRHCVSCRSGPFYSSSCSEAPALRTQMGIMCLVGVHAVQAMQARRRLSLHSLLQQPMIRDACPANPNGNHVPSGAQAMQAMRVLRRLSPLSALQQLMRRDACPANSNGNHVPSRCSCDAGYSSTVAAAENAPVVGSESWVPLGSLQTARAC